MKEVTRQMRKRGFGRVGKTPTLCWFCQNAVPDNDGHGCEWSRHGNPVDGWDVMPGRIRAKDSRGGSTETKSYHVRECPEFVEDPIPSESDQKKDEPKKEAAPKKETLKEKKSRLSRGGQCPGWVSLIKF